MDKLHPRRSKQIAVSGTVRFAVDCVVLMRGERETPHDADASMPRVWLCEPRHHFRRRDIVIETQRYEKGQEEQGGMKLTGTRMQDSRQERVRIPKGSSRSLVKLIFFLERPLNLDQQGVEFGPVGRVLGEPAVLSRHGVLGTSD